MANNTKMNISYSIKAVDRFSKTHAKLEKQLGRIDRMVKDIDGVKNINISVNNDRANAELEQTEQKVEDIPKVKVITLVTKGLKDGQRRFDRFATTLRNLDEIGMGMARGALWTLVPALGPALAVAAGGAGALASALGSVAVGGAAFASVLAPAIMGVVNANKEMRKAEEKVAQASSPEEKAQAIAELTKLQNGLTSSQLKTIKAMRDFGSFYKDFAKEFENPSLNVFIRSMGSLKTVMWLAKPAIEGVFEAVNNLFDAFDRNLRSEDVRKFFDWVAETAGPNLEKLTKAVGNFLIGFGNMLVAFDPLAQSFMDGLLGMSESFREWTKGLDKNKSFQKFMSYVEENGPLLLSTFGNFIRLLVDLGIAMAPVGTQVLEFANTFFKWASSVLENNEMMGHIIALLIVLRGVFAVLWPILLFGISLFRSLWPILKIVGSWVLKLGGVLLRIIPIIARVGFFILRFMTGPIGLVINIIILLALIVWQNWDFIWKWTKKIFGWIKDNIIESWGKIKRAWQVVTELYETLKTKFSEMGATVGKWMGDIWDTIKETWDDVMSFFTDFDLSEVGADIMRGLIDGITSIDVKGAVKGIASDIKSGFTSFFSINSPSKLMRKDVGRWITLGVVDGMVGMASRAESEAERVANAIKRPFDEMNRDYSFSASGVAVARTSYENARNYTPVQKVETQSTNPSPEANLPAYAVINIGGYEAKGVIQYITREQGREKSVNKKFE